jgi:hypothetical protein
VIAPTVPEAKLLYNKMVALLDDVTGRAAR